MEKINIENDYRERVLSIWEKFKDINVLNSIDCYYRKYPILPQTILKNAILFIGINPSFTVKSKNTTSLGVIEFYPESTDDKKDIAYFEKFKDIAKYCNNATWSHLDLLFMRETNQKIIEEMTYDEKGKAFLQEQLEISFDIINRANPKIIIVSNSLASEFFGKKKKTKHSSFNKIWAGYNLEFIEDFDSKIGTYQITIDGKKTPIIFSGMLSGQRALDIGSLERLKWQVKMILDLKQQ